MNALPVGTVAECVYTNVTEAVEGHAPFGIASWYSVETLGHFDEVGNRITQTAHSPIISVTGSYRRYKHDLVWSDWVQIATATPPQELALPLEARVVEYEAGMNRYSKDQFGRVYVDISVVSSTGQNDLTGLIRVATLPIGYRPNTKVLSAVYVRNNAAINETVTTVSIAQDGIVYIPLANFYASTIHGQVSFLSSTGP